MPSALIRSIGSVCVTLALGALPSCASEQSCTEAGCEHSAVVTYPPNLVSGGYTLILDGDLGSANARCSDPSNPDTADNPEGLTCDGAGFMLDGHPLANARELRVTIVPDEGDEIVESVRLEAVDELNPNGPGCPPTCFVRNGQLRIGVGG